MEQNEIARQYAVKELEAAGAWRSDELYWILKLFKEDELEIKEYQALQNMAKYPHRITAGWTWGEIVNGLLTNDAIRSQLINFYEEEYSDYKDELNKDKHGKDTPIWVVIRPKEGELTHNTVYPLITKFHKHSRHIVLAINE